MNDNISPNNAPVFAADSTPQQLKVGGVTPFTATDFPGKLAATVFVQGCPWRCTYCHNPHLQPRLSASLLNWPATLTFLQSRVGLIDAVVFSGGEATIDTALRTAMAQVRQLGFSVGLHTAGIYPRRLADVLPLLDWVGFDVKAPFDRYEEITRIADSGRHVRDCIALLLASGLPYECRTTIHPALLSEPDLLSLATTLAELGVRHYALQAFRAQGCAERSLSAIPIHAYPSAAALQQIGALFSTFLYRR